MKCRYLLQRKPVGSGWYERKSRHLRLQSAMQTGHICRKSLREFADPFPRSWPLFANFCVGSPPRFKNKRVFLLRAGLRRLSDFRHAAHFAHVSICENRSSRQKPPMHRDTGFDSERRVYVPQPRVQPLFNLQLRIKRHSGQRRIQHELLHIRVVADRVIYGLRNILRRMRLEPDNDFDPKTLMPCDCNSRASDGVFVRGGWP